jgi:quinol-cytochrome oxidoreductase complex cytochrome b subunit
MRPTFFHHLHPPTIPAEQSRWRYTLGAGGTAVFLVLVLIITGALEMFYYIPTPSDSALSIQTISYLAPFGWLVRNLHFWAAQLLLVVSAVHLVRVIFTGAYAPPRRFNYLLGLVLFVLTILLDFTGYILRWDEGIQWALVVGTNLVKTIPGAGTWLYETLIGGTSLGAATLTRFYAWHIFGLTLIFVLMVGWHAFRVRRDGGIAIPPAGFRKTHERITRFELVRREVLAMLFSMAALILLSTYFPAPIASPINPTGTNDIQPGLSRAPWFFLWVQQMLRWGDPFFFGVVIPVLVLVMLVSIAYIFPKPVESELGRWFPHSNRLAQIFVAILAGVVIILTILSLLPDQ